MNFRVCLVPGVFVFLLVPGQARPQGAEASKVAPVWNLTEGFRLPESACYDAKSKKIYVSNMGTAPDAKDGSGYISIVTVGGKVDTSKWVTGLNAPKGIRTFDDTLWVACLDELVAIDIPTGKINGRTKPEGAKFLNDVAITKDGTVYVSDLIQSRIYSYNGREVKVFADGEECEWPNGIVVDGDQLVVAGWGKPEPDFTTKVPGRLFSFDLATKKKTLITAKPTANLDGVEPDGLGAYLVTDSIAGKILRIEKDGTVHTVMHGFKGPADCSYLPEKSLLILPRISDNAVTAYDLSKIR